MLDLWDEWIGKYKWVMVVMLVSVIALGVGVFMYRSDSPEPKLQILSASDESTSASSQTWYVDVSGEVENPGVYKLDSAARVEDAILIAGGFTNKVDTNWVQKHLNRAEKIRDGMKLHIPAVSEISKNNTAVNIITASDKINVNSASKQDLESLKGVGPVTAQKIIDNRPYSSVEDLLSKKVIGQKVFDEIRDELVAW